MLRNELRVTSITLVLLCAACLPTRAQAEIWRADIHSLVQVQIEKKLHDPSLDAESVASLPAEDVFQALPVEIHSSYVVDYDGFVTAYLTNEEWKTFRSEVASAGLVATVTTDHRIQLPWHSFEAGEAAERSDPAATTGTAVPGLFLVQFGYPMKAEWMDALAGCAVTSLAYFQERTLLVRAAGSESILDCGAVTPYLSWIDSFLNTDRFAPDTLAAENAEGWDFFYAPGTNVAAKTNELPHGVGAVVIAYPVGAISPQVLHVTGPVAQVRSVALVDDDLLSVTFHGAIELSDERQGQIVAGNHNGIKPNHDTPYLTWLRNRCLVPGIAGCTLAASNQQTVCVVDGGYDTGFDNSTQLPPNNRRRHPDLTNPERMLQLNTYPQSLTTWDRGGHGTMVSGIIAGIGGTPKPPAVPPAPEYAYPLADGAQFLYGAGISPSTRLVMARMSPISEDPDTLTDVHKFCSDQTATIANNSWNEHVTQPSGWIGPQSAYTLLAQLFDGLVLDADNNMVNGQQPLTIVFSAGNHALKPDGTISSDSVSSPALAKNVIAVGATTSYRPVSGPDNTGEPLACLPLPNNARPPELDAVHIAQVANFSGRGRPFAPLPPALAGRNDPKLHTVRVKPDLVAPGVRVFSTVPFEFVSYGTSGTNVNGCIRSWPPLAQPWVQTNTEYTPYTYGTGTSFAAPVVTGVATLARKWFLDRNATNVTPSLVKAALIATADDLGPSGLPGNDPRPSENYGWGRVNLGRLTDSAARFYIEESPTLAVGTGQQRSWTRTIDVPGQDTLIVLAWSDPPADVTGNSQAALKNNLGLAIDEVGSTGRFWRGNNFRENVVDDDTGYSYRFNVNVGEDPRVKVDAINNVEAIFIPANTFGTGQQLTIKVTGENVQSGPQKFALYAYNVRLLP